MKRLKEEKKIKCVLCYYITYFKKTNMYIYCLLLLKEYCEICFSNLSEL